MEWEVGVRDRLKQRENFPCKGGKGAQDPVWSEVPRPNWVRQGVGKSHRKGLAIGKDVRKDD
jgi:hypothetical protein